MFLLITNFISSRVDYNVRFASGQSGKGGETAYGYQLRTEQNFSAKFYFKIEK